nr:hypothetical protein CFP56_64584 [Quercus suber]
MASVKIVFSATGATTLRTRSTTSRRSRRHEHNDGELGTLRCCRRACLEEHIEPCTGLSRYPRPTASSHVVDQENSYAERCYAERSPLFTAERSLESERSLRSG